MQSKSYKKQSYSHKVTVDIFLPLGLQKFCDRKT